MLRAMTMPGAVSVAGAHAPADRKVWRAELTETVGLAMPLALSQLGQIAMMTSDLALIGRLGDQAVAAAALAHTVLFTMFVIGMGIVGPGAGELIAEATLAVETAALVEDVAATIHAHPTLSETLMEAAENLLG